MQNLERAKVFCQMSFTESDRFPCVTSYHASEVFNDLFFADSTAEDFRLLLIELFGEKFYSGNEIFYLNRQNFFNRAYRAQKIKDLATMDALADEIEYLAQAVRIFGGCDKIEIHSGREENSGVLV